MTHRNRMLAAVLLLCLPRRLFGQTGTTIVVRMIDAVDSSSDPAGKQYRAGLTHPVNVGNGVIVAQGSVATVTLARNASGWDAHLWSLTINGQVVPVTSSTVTVVGAAAGMSSAADTVNSVFGTFGRKPSAPVVAAVTTGARVVLTSGITLSFVLSGITPPPPPPPPSVAESPATRTSAELTPATSATSSRDR